MESTEGRKEVYRGVCQGPTCMTTCDNIGRRPRDGAPPEPRPGEAEEQRGKCGGDGQDRDSAQDPLKSERSAPLTTSHCPHRCHCTGLARCVSALP